MTMDARAYVEALGGRWSGSSGMCRCPAHDDRTPSLSITNGTDGRVLFNCHAGCTWEQLREYLPQGGRAARYVPTAEERKARARQERDGAARREEQARRCWEEASRPGGTVVEAYLAGRGVSLPEGGALRHHPSCWHQSAKRPPAMVARITGPRGFAIHRTYLDPEGGKADVEPNRMMLGETKGGAVRLLEGRGALLVAEGIETALSLPRNANDAVWAALSASLMREMELPTAEVGRHLVIGADGDEAGRAAARVLAARAHAAGWAVEIATAPDGKDWNDDPSGFAAALTPITPDPEPEPAGDDWMEQAPPHTEDDMRIYSIDGGKATEPSYGAAADPRWGEGEGLGQAGRQREWRIHDAESFVAGFTPPDYLIQGVMQRGRLYTLTAPTGHGKTAVMLYAAHCVATSEDFCGQETDGGDVLFLAGENPDDVRARAVAMMDKVNRTTDDWRVHFVPGTFDLRQDMVLLKERAAELPGLAMIVVDTFAAYFDGDDENNNAQALSFARVLRELTDLTSKPVVVVPAHPVKNAARSNLSPKGGSSLVNEVDGNLTVWNSDGLVELHWQVKHRGPDFEPLRLELVRYECDSLRDTKGRLMPTILAQPVLTLRAAELAKDSMSKEDELLLSIEQNGGLSLRERCRELGWVSDTGSAQESTLRKVRTRLIKDKLVKPFRGRVLELTADGKKAVQMILDGAQMPADREVGDQ